MNNFQSTLAIGKKYEDYV